MVTIIFESHGTTVDNENRRASGHLDAALSPLGEEQARRLGERRKDEKLDVIFCSDLQRSYRTAEIAFVESTIPIIRDARLRECDYGDRSGESSTLIEQERGAHVMIPWPKGESYEQTTDRMRRFLDELRRDYDGKRVLIIGHRATWYGLEHLIKRVPLDQVVTDPWKWQPGWEYHLAKLPVS